MNKCSQGNLSAVLCTVVHNYASDNCASENNVGENRASSETGSSKTGSCNALDTPFIDDSTAWLALIEAELTDNDRFTIRNGYSFVIELRQADEGRALQIARLIRNSFQLHMAPGNKVRLSTGVVLHPTEMSSNGEFLGIAEKLAEKHSSDVGNKISFENHTSAAGSASPEA